MSRIKVYFALETQREKKTTLVVPGQSTIDDAIEKLHQQNIVRDIFKEQRVEFVGLLPRSDLSLPEKLYKRDLALASTSHPIEDCLSAQDDIILLRCSPAVPAATARPPVVIDLLSSSDEEDEEKKEKHRDGNDSDHPSDHSEDDSSYDDEDPKSATVRSAWATRASYYGKKKSPRNQKKAPNKKFPAPKKKKKRTFKVKDTLDEFKRREGQLERKRLASQRRKKEIEMFGDRVPNDGVPRRIDSFNTSPFGKAPPGELIPEVDRFDRRIYVCKENETPADIARKYLICRPNPAGRVVFDNRNRHRGMGVETQMKEGDILVLPPTNASRRHSQDGDPRATSEPAVARSADDSFDDETHPDSCSYLPREVCIQAQVKNEIDIEE